MRRPKAAFLASAIAWSALFALSRLAATDAEASPTGDGQAVPIISAPRPGESLPFDAILPAQYVLTCTATITTPNSDVTNNFGIPSAAFLFPYANLSLMTPNVPPGITVTVQTQYFRLDALQGFHYLVSAIPNTASSYNLNITVFDSSATAIMTGTKPLSVMSSTVDFAPPSTGLYYFGIYHVGANCPPSGTYRLTVSGPLPIIRVTYLPLVVKDHPPPVDVRVTALSGTTIPEYVTLQNFGDADQPMTGWYLVSEVGSETFQFPSGYILGRGAAVRIESYTDVPDNPPAILRWATSEIWNDGGDKAVLYDNLGTPISRMCYGNTCP